MAKPRRRSAAKIATKREQTGLVETAERLGEDPSPLVPRVQGRVRTGPVKRLERRLRKISAGRASERRLRRYLRWGPRLARAYAHLLLVGHRGGAKRMGSLKTPVGELKYAVRANLSARITVAVQHQHHPEVRILGYRELAQKTGGIVWADEAGVILTGRNDPPPDEWYDLVLDSIDFPLERTPDGLRTPDLVDITDLTAPDAPYALQVVLATGPTRISLSAAKLRDLVPSGGRSLLGRLAVYLIGLDPKRDVTVTPLGTPTDCHHPGDTCLWATARPAVRKRPLERYQSGELNERDLLDRIRPDWEEAVRLAGGRLYCAGGNCYGADPDRLLDALGLSGDTRAATRMFLEEGPPVVLAEEFSHNKVLEAAWAAAPRVLVRLHPRPEELDVLIERHKRSPPATILEEVLAEKTAAERLAGYPRYERLPTGAAVADRLFRAHTTGDAPAVLDTVDKELKRATHKGLLWAALTHYDATQGRAWQFDKNDQEAGGFLIAPLQALFEAGPDSYHTALKKIHTLSGGTGELPEPVGTH
ncbi:MAG: hypothetical protein KY455_08440 [Euryarchaeota archaeon]|nr:hypothetical protein [Euryarchaeota archaeon]